MLNGKLEPTEPHPAAFSARAWIANIPYDKLMLYREAYASCAIENNELAELYLGTLNRLLNSEVVGDRYVLGLAWELKRIMEEE